MGRNKEFEEWFDEYFCNQQGEDSPYMYQDVKIAFYSGWKAHKKSLSKLKPKNKSSEA